MADVLGYVIPAINFILLLVVLRQLIQVRHLENPLAVCLRTGHAQCIALAEPELLCEACRARLGARIAEVQHHAR
jgi:hypothetical protein